MSLFVQQNNQQILWDVISMCNMFNEVFTTDNEKYIWFNSIIENIKNNIRGEITLSELPKINKNAIKLMMVNLKNLYLKSSTTRSSQIVVGSDSDTPYMIRQKEYDSMKKSYVPPPVNFSSVEDLPITNLSELLEKHLTERKNALDSISHENNIESNDNTNTAKNNVSWLSPIVENENLDNDTLGTKIDHIDKRFNTIIDDVNKKFDTIIELLSTRDQIIVPKPLN
jgi:hypothetical protein